MKAARFDYVRPSDVGDALAALAKAEGAKLLAGGQSLGPMLNLRLARPALLVDVSRLEALQQVEDTGRAWRIGAGVTHARLEDGRGRLPGGARCRRGRSDLPEASSPDQARGAWCMAAH